MAINLEEKIRSAITPGMVFDNPGGGTSTIEAVGDRGISYRRGNSIIVITFEDISAAYEKFNGRRVTSTELRAFMPSVFDSQARPAGHSCNCTFFFTVMQKIGLAGPLEGAGVRGSPFSIELSA